MSALIESKGLSKWFGEVVAVNNLDLRIERGITGLLGPNGAGKSTFIKLALGLYAPSRGYIHVLGGPPRNNLDVLRRIAYCPETDTFYENMTGYEFVYWLNRYWGMGRKDAARAAEAACDLVHMTARMHDPIDEYSKGMRQRIKIAQALTRQPEMLFLDEPMNGLDPQGREEMFALIRRLGDEGHSVIVSSHILYEVERATDNVVLLYNGSVLAQGRVREIRDLIDDHPHTIEVGSPDPRLVARLFSEDPGIMSIEFDAGRVTLRTRDPQACYQRLNQLVLEGAAPVDSITCADDNLQSVFAYLVAK
jgi:ABC-2 type transport system ATP-binding protein